MSHNISNFIAQMGGGNALMRPSQFELSIPGMPKWTDNTKFGEKVKFYCNSASLPGINIDSIDNRTNGTGYLEYFPTGVSFYDLQTTFYADQNAEIVTFFQDWTRNVVNWDLAVSSDEKYRIKYRDFFVSQVQVVQFDTEGNPLLEYTYVDAFPVNIQPIGVRWFSRDEITEFEVIWKYRVWKSKAFKDGSTSNLGLSTAFPGSGLPGFTTVFAKGVNGIVGRVNSVQNAVGQVQNVIGQGRKTVNAVQNAGSLFKSKFRGLL